MVILLHNKLAYIISHKIDFVKAVEKINVV